MKTEGEIRKKLQDRCQYLDICVNEEGEPKPEGIDQEIKILEWVLENKTPNIT